MKRVLITGATGFCGKYLTEHLRSRGYHVSGSYLPQANRKLKSKFKNLDFLPLDLTQYPDVKRVVARVKPDFIFHLAAQSIAHGSVNRLRETFTVNVGATIHLLNAIWNHAPKSRLVFISSSQVYGSAFRKGVPVTESVKPSPQNPYAFSKYLAELACQNFIESSNLDILIARPFNHFGAGQAPNFVFSEWCRQIAQIEAKIIPPELRVGNIKVKRDFLHVRDVVRAYETIALQGKSGGVYNIATGKPVQLATYLDYLLRLAKVPVKIKIDKNLFRKNELQAASGKYNRLKQLGWQPEETAFDALKELLEDWRGRIKKDSK